MTGVSRVIVVDDGSSDSTAQVASDAGAEVVRLADNQGKARAMEHGFNLASPTDWRRQTSWCFSTLIWRVRRDILRGWWHRCCQVKQT